MKSKPKWEIEKPQGKFKIWFDIETENIIIQHDSGVEDYTSKANIYHHPEHGWLISILYSKIAKKITGKKQDLRLRIGDIGKEIDEYIEQKIKEKREKQREELKKLLGECKYFYMGIGGDTHKIYISSDIPSELRNLEEYEHWKEKNKTAIRKVIHESETRQEWFEKLGIEKTDVKTALYNILFDDGTWGKISTDNEYLRRAIEEIEEEKNEKEKERQRKQKEYEEKKRKAIEKAKRTGKNVIIRKIGVYDGDDWKQVQEYGTDDIKRQFGSELGVVNVYEVATPDGKIVEWHCPSY